ncbi:MAG TPA: M14 family zinc carboxypeptidase [Jiangellaceae bacterium]|nr:M14 family zinc carboxypeptidase [Jiangellaceae bacterium]
MTSPHRARFVRLALIPMVAGVVTIPIAASAVTNTPEDRREFSSPLYDRPQDFDDTAFDAAHGCEFPGDGSLPEDRFVTYDEHVTALEAIESESAGRVDVDVVGQSHQGRDIYAGRVGDGDKVVYVTGSIHGNEKTGPEAALAMLDYLGRSDHREARAIRQGITLVAVPMMNPDGNSRSTRQNQMPWDDVVEEWPQLQGAPQSWNYSERVDGFDTNRDYNPDLDYVVQPEDLPGDSASPGFYITPEASAVRDLYVDLQDEFGTVDTYVDLHHQAPCYTVGDSDDLVTMSISGKFFPDLDTPEGEKYREYEDTYRPEYAKQLNVAAWNSLQDAAEDRPIFGNISLYPQDIDLPGTGLGSFALNGSGAVLFEVRGQTQSMGHLYREFLVRTVFHGLEGILTAVATGTVDDLDPADYDDIPPRNTMSDEADGGETAAPESGSGPMSHADLMGAH